MNSLLACPLPVEGLVALSELLGILSSTKDVGIGSNNGIEESLIKGSAALSEIPDEGEELDNNAPAPKENTSDRSAKIFDLLAVCEAEVLRAAAKGSEYVKIDTSESEKKEQEETRPQNSHASDAVINNDVYEPLLPPSVTEHFHEAMHDALMNVMAERDEAHAQLIAANVLHIHQLEQEKKKNERLRIELEVAEEMSKLQMPMPNVAQFFGAKPDDSQRRELEAKMEEFERILGKNQDDDIDALCNQLAGEISAKTSNALEILRLKESREIEKKNLSQEKKALQEELKRVKDLLAIERKTHQDAVQDATRWKAMYEQSVGAKNSSA